MSHNSEAPRAASQHKPAIFALIVALLAALIAFMVFRPGLDEQNEGIATTPVIVDPVSSNSAVDPQSPAAQNPPPSQP